MTPDTLPIPDGYVLVPPGSKIEPGDKFYSETHEGFMPTKLPPGVAQVPSLCYIRPVKAKTPPSLPIPDGYSLVPPAALLQAGDLFYGLSIRRFTPISPERAGHPQRTGYCYIRPHPVKRVITPCCNYKAAVNNYPVYYNVWLLKTLLLSGTLAASEQCTVTSDSWQANETMRKFCVAGGRGHLKGGCQKRFVFQNLRRSR